MPARPRPSIACSRAPNACSSASTPSDRATAKPAVTARLLNRGGTAMSDLAVQVSPAGATQMEVPLAQLAAGDYLLELTAKGDAGSAQDMIAFRLR